MKKQLLSTIFILLMAGFAHGQCVPDPSLVDPGFYPDVATNLPVGTAGVFYSTDIQFKVLTDTSVGPLTVTVNDITLNSVTGLPSGFAYTATPANGVFPGGSNGCVRLSGSNAAAGTYPLVINVTMHGTLFGFPITLPATIPGYNLVLDPPVLPVAAFTASGTTVCKGSVVTFTDMSLNNPTSWSWSFPGGILPTSNDQNPEVLYDTPGTYDVTLTVTNAAGSSTVVETALMVVNALPPVSVTPSGTSTVCRGEPVTLSANAGAGLTYQWYKYGNIMPGETNQTLTTTYAGKYKVKVIDSNTGCEKKSGQRIIVVNQLPVVSIASTGPTTFCKDGSVELSATLIDPTNTLQWVKGYTDVPGETGYNYTAYTNSWMRVRATDANGCSKLSTGIAVNVLPSPNAGIYANGPLTFCNGDSVSLTVALPDASNTYQWELDLVPIGGASGYEYIAYGAGKYTYFVTAPNGCFRRSPVRKVIINCRLAAPETPATTFNASVHPNPANERANVELELPEAGMLSFNVYDITGKEQVSFLPVYTEAGYQTVELETTELKSGIYLLRVESGSFAKTIRLVVEH